MKNLVLALIATFALALVMLFVQACGDDDREPMLDASVSTDAGMDIDSGIDTDAEVESDAAAGSDDASETDAQ